MKLSYKEIQSITDISFLEKNYTNYDFFIRKAIAKNKNCPIHILEKLSNDEEIIIKISVITNENCPIEILKKFCSDENFYFGEIIAISSNNIEILNLLANKGNLNFNLHSLIVQNDNCPFDLLKNIYKKYTLVDENIKANYYFSIKNITNLITEHPNWKIKDFT